MLRLLPKSEVDKKRAEEKRQSIDEGMKLAERVDSLRAMLADEEGVAKTYRISALNGIQEEINELIAEREKLDSDIRAKKAQWVEQPIELQWAAYVKGEKKHIDKQVKENDSMAVQFNTKIAAAIKREKEASDKIATLEQERGEYLRLIAEARKQETQSKEVLAKARNEAHTLLVREQVRDTKSQERSKQLDRWHQNLSLENQDIEKQKIELQEREYRVLARELAAYSPIKKL